MSRPIQVDRHMPGGDVPAHSRADHGKRAGRGMLAGTVASVLAGIGLVGFAARSGGTLANPRGYLVYEVGIVVVAAALVTAGAVQSVRTRRLSPVFLMAVAPATAFWQETYGDWGTYLIYSGRFRTYGWGDTAFSSPVRCWWFIAGYAVFYSTLFLSMTSLVGYVRTRWPRKNEYVIAIALTLPVFYVFDLLFEASTVGLGYWHYTYAFGPSMPVGHGTFPLLWPIVEQVPFIAIATVGMSWRNSRGENVFDVAAGWVTRGAPGRLAIVTSWIVLVNLTFAITTIVPLMAMRWLAGPPSVLVP